MSAGNNSGGRFAEDVLDEAADTLYRLRDFQVREPPIHVPTREERRQAEVEADEEERRLENHRMRQREREAADAAELAAAEQEVEHEEQWDGWIRRHLDAERQTIVDIMGEVVAQLRDETEKKFGGRIFELTKQVEQERAARRRDRDAARERARSMQQAYREKIETLRAMLDAMQRSVDLLEIRQRESKAEHARRVEREENTAVMMRALYEEMMLRR
jgi:hypothetical protein